MRLCSNGPCLSGQNSIPGKNGLTGHKNNMSVILYIDKEDDPQNLHVVFCPNKEHSFEPSMFRACCRTLAAVLVSEFCLLSFIFHLLVIYHVWIFLFYFFVFYSFKLHGGLLNSEWNTFIPVFMTWPWPILTHSYSKVKTKSYFQCWATVHMYFWMVFLCCWASLYPSYKIPRIKMQT